MTTTQMQTKSEAKPEQHKKALEVMASRMSLEPAKVMSALKDTVFKGATDAELVSLVVVANEYRLNPFLREIHAFKGKGGGIVPVVGIDGWVKLVNSHPDFDGVVFEFADSDNGEPESCTCKMFVKGRAHPVQVTEYYAECKRESEPWKGMPRRMLRHKAYIQCGRIAFGFAGIHDEDEAIDIVSQVKPEVVQPKFDSSPADFLSQNPEPVEAANGHA